MPHGAEYEPLVKFLTPEEAALIRMQLEAAGIDCYLEGANTANLFQMPASFSGVKLFVARDRIEAAERILADHGFLPEEESDPGESVDAAEFGERDHEQDVEPATTVFGDLNKPIVWLLVVPPLLLFLWMAIAALLSALRAMPG